MLYNKIKQNLIYKKFLLKIIQKEYFMNKKIAWILSAFLVLNSLQVIAAGVDKLEPIGKKSSGISKTSRYEELSRRKREEAENQKVNRGLDKETMFYPNANIKSAMSKYKAGNYTGCLQELFSLVQKEPANALAYYYMAMAYTHIDRQADAIEAYEKVLSLNPNEYLAEYATRGRDCLTGGPACQDAQTEELSELDKFINAPYGNGLSPELNQEVKQKELTNIKETINKKEHMEEQDVEKIRQFDDKYESFADGTEKIAQVSDEDVLNAIKTLKDAGVNVTVQQDNPYAQMTQYQNPQMAEMSMLLGGNNNNNANNMMNMIPMLMSQTQKGENIDPRVMQALMMNSMMSDFNYMNNNNNNN